MQPEATVNISEVCQQTGVAAVTLRAWERRYGLIKPSRTPKGHRLYSEANIEQIRQIVRWLNRGVAISKVAGLLTAGETESNALTDEVSWQHVQHEILSTLMELKQRSLNPLIDKLNKSMPFVNLCEKVYQPLAAQLMARWQSKPLGYQLEQQLWQQCWKRQITIMTLRADKQKSRANCWLVNLDDQCSALDYWLFYALLLQSGVQINAINQVDDLSALPRLRNSLDQPLIVYGDHKIITVEINQVAKILSLWEKGTIVVGRVADIHQVKFASMGIEHVGGDASSCWQSTCCQSWVEQMVLKEKQKRSGSDDHAT
jgi:DNA-binding transcriptional MerR regulator